MTVRGVPYPSKQYRDNTAITSITLYITITITDRGVPYPSKQYRDNTAITCTSITLYITITIT